VLEFRARLRRIFMLVGPVIAFPLIGWDAHQRGDRVPAAGLFWPVFWSVVVLSTISLWVLWWKARPDRR
jgi:hypothetical protein